MITLTAGDRAELLKWVELSGMECVARVAAALTVDPPKHRPKTIESELLREIAQRIRDTPARTEHSVEEELASEAIPHTPAKNSDLQAVDSLKRLLINHYTKYRTRWRLLAIKKPEERKTYEGKGRAKRAGIEAVALERIIDAMPSAIDPYEMLLLEAKRLRPNGSNS